MTPWLTEDMLFRSVLELTREKAAELLAPVRLMLDEAQADTPEQAAAMLGQVAHESCGLTVMVEQASGRAYEGRVDLGNVQPGDGPRYRGRGWIQLTGRHNYRAAGLALGLPLEDQPELAERVEVAARTAAWYWRTHVSRGWTMIPAWDAYEAITRAINGGLNGLEDRKARWAHARKAFGLPPVTT